MGSNGSGKTTLLNIIAGTVDCDRGTIRIMGRDVTKLKEHQRARHIARVFQDPKIGPCPIMTVAENLAMATRKGKSYGLSSCLKKDRQRFGICSNAGYESGG